MGLTGPNYTYYITHWYSKILDKKGWNQAYQICLKASRTAVLLFREIAFLVSKSKLIQEIYVK
jgi:hypothetical protein